MKEVRLYGEFAKRFGRSHYYHVNTPRQAISLIRANFPEFDSVAEGRIYVVSGKNNALSEAELDLNLSPDVIKIIPQVMGAKSGWTNIAIAVVAAVASYYTAGASAAEGSFWKTAAGSAIHSTLTTIAVSSALTGVSQLIASTPSTQSDDGSSSTKASYTFTGAVNTDAQGGCYPIGYGRMRIGGMRLSTAMAVGDLTPSESGVGFRFAIDPYQYIYGVSYGLTPFYTDISLRIPVRERQDPTSYFVDSVNGVPGNKFGNDPDSLTFSLVPGTALDQFVTLVVTPDIVLGAGNSADFVLAIRGVDKTGAVAKLTLEIVIENITPPNDPNP